MPLHADSWLVGESEKAGLRSPEAREIPLDQIVQIVCGVLGDRISGSERCLLLQVFIGVSLTVGGACSCCC